MNSLKGIFSFSIFALILHFLSAITTGNITLSLKLSFKILIPFFSCNCFVQAVSIAADLLASTTKKFAHGRNFQFVNRTFPLSKQTVV